MQHSDTPTLIDWKILRTALTVLLISVVLSIGIVTIERYYAQSTQAWAAQQQAQLEALTIEFRQVQEAQEIMDTRYNSDFLALDEQRFFYTGDVRIYNQHRLQLVDELNAAIDSLLLPEENPEEIAYDTPRIHTIKGIEMAKNFKVRATQIRLQLGLLHEGDLLNLVDRLNSRDLPGILHWQSCILQPLGDLVTDNVTQANFEVNCMLVWYLAEIEQ